MYAEEQMSKLVCSLLFKHVYINVCRFPVPDLREAVSVKVYNQPKLRQEVCYADISSLMFKTCLDDSKLTKYELQLDTLKGNIFLLSLKLKCLYVCCVHTYVRI